MLCAPVDTVSRTASTGFGVEPLLELLRRRAACDPLAEDFVDPAFLWVEADLVLAMRVLLLRERVAEAGTQMVTAYTRG